MVALSNTQQNQNLTNLRKAAPVSDDRPHPESHPLYNAAVVLTSIESDQPDLFKIEDAIKRLEPTTQALNTKQRYLTVAALWEALMNRYAALAASNIADPKTAEAYTRLAKSASAEFARYSKMAAQSEDPLTEWERRFLWLMERLSPEDRRDFLRNHAKSYSELCRKGEARVRF